MKTLKTALSLLLTLCLLLSLGAVAFADGEEQNTEPAEGSSAPASAPAAPAVGGAAGNNDSSADTKAGGTVGNNYNTGDVQASNTTQTSGVMNHAVTVETTNNSTKVLIDSVDLAVTEQPTEVDPGGGVTVALIRASGENPATVTIGGSIDVNSGGGLYVGNTSGSITVNVGDNNTVGNVTGVTNGVSLLSTGTSSTTVNITGDVTGTDGNGMLASLTGTNTINVDGNVTGVTNGVSLSSTGTSSTTVNITGDVTGTDGDGMFASLTGTNTINVDGSITGNGSTHGAGLYADNAGNSTITVTGDVTGTTAPLATYNYGEKLDIIIGGDVKGTAGISISGDAGDGTTITVGSVDSNGSVTGGTVTGGINLDGVDEDCIVTSVTVWKVDGEITGASDTVIKSVINYLVGLVQPDEGSISAPKTTKEDQKVYLTAGKGYQITAAYNGEGSQKEELQKDGKGFYYMITEQTRGGGILLSALLEKIKPAPVASSSDNWTDGYYLFCKAAAKQIKNAEQNATVTVDGTGWASFMRLVLEALAERPDVTLVVKYGTSKELTVPAGTDILALIGSAQDVTFAKLAKLVG